VALFRLAAADLDQMWLKRGLRVPEEALSVSSTGSDPGAVEGEASVDGEVMIGVDPHKAWNTIACSAVARRCRRSGGSRTPQGFAAMAKLAHRS
jgi:hypothetical protein